MTLRTCYDWKRIFTMVEFTSEEIWGEKKKKEKDKEEGKVK